MTIRPLLPILLAAATPTAFAQSASTKIPDSRTHIPPVTTPALTPKPAPASALANLIVVSPQVIVLPSRNITIARNSTCYALHTYEFSQSATPTLTSESTCQPASTTHLKSTILTRPATPNK